MDACTGCGRALTPNPGLAPVGAVGVALTGQEIRTVTAMLYKQRRENERWLTRQGGARQRQGIEHVRVKVEIARDLEARLGQALVTLQAAGLDPVRQATPSA